MGSLDELDNQTGVLHVWFLVLEGLADAVATGPKAVQPQILHALFDLLKAAVHVTGENVILVCLIHTNYPLYSSEEFKKNVYTMYCKS